MQIYLLGPLYNQCVSELGVSYFLLETLLNGNNYWSFNYARPLTIMHAFVNFELLDGLNGLG